MMPLAYRPSANESETSNKPTPQDQAKVHWSESVTSFDAIDDGDAADGENHHGIDVDDDQFDAAAPSTLQLVVSGKRAEPKIDLRWTKLPSFSFSGWSRRIDNRPLRVRLYQAALKGDWKTAKSIDTIYPGALSMVISDRGETALHIATRVKKPAFVGELVMRIDPHDLALKNKYGNTALCIAAASGAVNIAKLMVQQYEGLPLIRGSGNATPVLIAARYKCKEMVSYLLSKTPVYGLAIQEQMELLVGAISADYYDIALLILEWNMKLALERDFNEDSAMHIMARKSTAIGSKNKPSMWQSCMNCCFKRMYKKRMMQIQAHQLVELMWEIILKEIPEKEMLDFIKYPSSMLHDAARVGNVEFLRVLINSYPDLAWKVDGRRKSIFHVAVQNRQRSVFSLIYEMGEFLDYLPYYFDEENVSLLELAARKAAPSHLNRVSGAAFQMHRELLWFKEVEKIVELTMGRKKGKQTPRELFTTQHKNLVEEGEKWMKKTANSCMLVATLIATVVFAAAFTLPGGNINNTGSPVFLHHKWFAVFVISDATALISSSTSILLFLSILTSRCAEDDFLMWLPLKLVFGLTTLFFSVLGMVLAFSATFFMLYGTKATAWVPLLIAGMAILPVYCFCVLQFKLWADALAALKATWMSYLFFRNRKMKVF